MRINKTAPRAYSELCAQVKLLLAAVTVAAAGICALWLTPVTSYASPGADRDDSIQSPESSHNADPALTQTLDENEQIAPAGSTVEISSGHIDMGPKMIDGSYRLMARDDTSSTPVWRELDDMVFRVSDKAIMDRPNDEAYSFIHGDGQLWTIPQQEIEGVVWLGWNTQDPALLSSLNGGVKLIYGGHQGDGEFYAFVQAGNFSGPQQLWNSEKNESQPVHVEPNTHTHANWIFTAPGIHLVRITAQAQLTDGTTVEDTQILRFAVGDSADAQQALKAQWDRKTTPSAPAEVEEPSALDSSENFPLLIGVSLMVLGFAALFTVLIVRKKTRGVQARALQNIGIASAPGSGDVNGGSEDSHLGYDGAAAGLAGLEASGGSSSCTMCEMPQDS